MSVTSSNLSLPFIQPAQAQKHITHNEALRMLDSLVQLSVIDTALSTPPATPADGDRYIIAPNATDNWAGHDQGVTVWAENAWLFYPPQIGWAAWDQAMGQAVTYDGTTWAPTPLSLSTPDTLGINTGADTTNRLAVAADATLLTHDITGGHQLKINKDSTADTNSLLFQTGWSGRAEMGTTGSNDFEIKVSADGASFHQGLVIDHTTGLVTFPNGASGGGLGDLVTNGTGHLGNTYNFPTPFIFDTIITPNLPGSFAYAGHFTGRQETAEFIPVDPNQTYRLQTYLYQDAAAGDWAAYTHGDRHQQSMGILAFDQGKTLIATPDKRAYFKDLILPQTDTWYRATNHIGGIDTSGSNVTANFAPGTAYVKVFWLPNHSNSPGGSAAFPDTGSSHKIRFAGVSVIPESLATMAKQTDGSVSLKIPHPDATTGAISLTPQGLTLTGLG